MHSEKTKWGKAMHSIEVIVKMKGRVTLQTEATRQKYLGFDKINLQKCFFGREQTHISATPWDA